MAYKHSISFLCGNNLAVSYSSRFSSFIRHQATLLQLCWESQQWIRVSIISCIQLQEHSRNKQHTSHLPVNAKLNFKVVHANLPWTRYLQRCLFSRCVYLQSHRSGGGESNSAKQETVSYLALWFENETQVYILTAFIKTGTLWEQHV